MKWLIRTLFVIFITASGIAQENIRMTVLYDNYTAVENVTADWGFACLIEAQDKSILYDTGTNPDVLLKNSKTLNVDLGQLDMIIITHNHGDHTGGLETVLKLQPDLPVYYPKSFPEGFEERVSKSGGKNIRVDQPLELCKGIWLTGEMGNSIKELSLISETDKGLVIVTGCSHQGIVNILKKSKEICKLDIDLVFGGFHLMRHSDKQVNAIIDDFRDLGVNRCGATHCTGDRQIGLFKQAFGDNYVPMGVGRILEFQPAG